MLSDRELNSRSAKSHGSSSNASHDDCTPDKHPKTKTPKRRRSSSDEEDFDTSIDTKLRQSAKRNNLTPKNVKNILQKVVRNDHVLAIVKLTEEKLEKQEQAMKELKMSNESSTDLASSMDTNDVDDAESAGPKLTRAKAKALNKFPLPVAPIKHSEPDSEVVALIREELHSDDDDEEYQPGEDDIESDDDINTTTSDIDSQPATPSSQADPSDDHSPTKFTKDGLFKIPRARNDSSTSQTEQEYIIAQQTRSKISLTETPIEAIESTFKAPDAPIDMYQCEDDDPNWKQFLNILAKPISATEAEKDEDADPDPEYIPPSTIDSQPDDREDFLNVNVSKKELSDLFNDIANIIDVNLLDMCDFADTISNPPKQIADPVDDLNTSLVTPNKQIDEPLNTPDASKNQSHSQSQLSPEPSQTNISYFDPRIMSTPGNRSFNNSNNSLNDHVPQQQQLQTPNQQPIDSFSSTSSLNENRGVPQYSYQYPPFAFSPTVQHSPIVVAVTTNSIAPPIASKPSASYFVSMPTDSITTTAIPSTVTTPMQLSNSAAPPSQTVHAEDSLKKPGCRAKKSRFKSIAYQELESLNPNSIQPQVQCIQLTDERGFTSEQRDILYTQLRMHVQMTTQTYIQTYGHPELYAEAYKFKKYLMEFDDIIHKRHAKSIYNLKPALQLISNWEDELSQNTKENTELVNYLRHEMDKFRKNMSYNMKFHHRILNLICQSKVFIYPDLLPAVPFRFKTAKPSEYFPAEDFLIAFLLEHFFDVLQRQLDSYKLAKPKVVTLTSVCHHISAHLGYIRHWKSIYDYVRLRRTQPRVNPIQHKKAPPVRHRHERFDKNAVVEPAKQPPSKLPKQFAQHVETLVGFAESNAPSTEQHPQSNENQLSSSISTQKKCKSVNEKCQTIEQKYTVPVEASAQSPIEVKVIYKLNDFDDYKSVNKCDKNEIKTFNEQHEQHLIKGQQLLTSYFSPIQRKSKENVLTISIDSDNSTEYFHNEKTDKNCLLLYRKQIRRKYNRSLKVRRTILVFLVHLIRTANKQFTEHRFDNRNLFLVYYSFILYHRFTVEVSNQLKNKRNNSKKMSAEALVLNRRAQKLLNDSGSAKENEEIASTTHNHTDGSTKRPPKSQRSTDTSKLLLLTENPQESSEKDFLFAQRFIDRVEETFINENKHHKFLEFLAILRKFSENQLEQSGASLYLILEEFLMPNYPDLVDLFLYFLLPRDAVAINKSMDYFLKVNLSKFLNKVNIFFQKQPAQIRKVLACLKELSDEPDVTIDRMRTRILPLLKGNQLLIDWFLQCVAPDKCDSSKEEYETLVLRKGNESFDDDQFEYIPQSEIMPDPTDNPCHIRYMNGRIFYGSRFPLPAKLAFSAVPCTTTASETVESEFKPSIGSVDKSLIYRCVHNIKEFADNKMKDRNHSELEPVSNSSSANDEPEANSDDEQQHCIASIVKMEEKNSFDEDIDPSSSSSSGANEQILCDNTLLRAHSIRLNPSLHSPLVHMNAELLNKLKPPDQLSSDANKELRLSPKKLAAAAKCSANTQPKSSQMRKINSPNAKKTTAAGSKSPNNKKITSPLSTNTENVDNGNIGCQSAAESNAIQTAKKLKRILETTESTPSSNLTNEADDTSRRTVATVSSVKLKSQKSHMLSKPIKKQKRAHDFHESDEDEEIGDEKNDSKAQGEGEKEQQQQKDNQPTAATPPTLIQWTREEDRLLLEQIKAGLDLNSQQIAEFAQRFNKTQENIRDRHDFLIDFLKKLHDKK